MGAFGAVKGADVGFFEVAFDPFEIGIDKETAVDEEGALALALGVAGYFSAVNGQIARFMEFQGNVLLLKSFNDGHKRRSVSPHDVEAFEGRS